MDIYTDSMTGRLMAVGQFKNGQPVQMVEYGNTTHVGIRTISGEWLRFFENCPIVDMVARIDGGK